MSYCLHCNTPIDSRLQTSFCCNGCKAAYAIINKLNLQQYYIYCRNIYKVNPNRVYQPDNKINYYEEVEDLGQGERQIIVLVEGIKCASCVWLIEHVLLNESDITHARVNMTTNRLTLKWQGDTESIQNYIKLIEQLGYRVLPLTPDNIEEKNTKERAVLLKAIAVAGFGWAQVMMLSVSVWSGLWQDSIGPYLKLLFHLISAIIAIPAALYSGLIFFSSAYRAISARRVNMDIPISIAIILSILVSIQGITFNPFNQAHTYFDAALGLILALLAGRYLDFSARHKAKSKVQDLLIAQPQSITVLRDGALVTLRNKEVKKGEIAFISPGEKITVDGYVTEGESNIDVSLMNGESMPETVSVGKKVYAGTVNITSPIKIKIETLGEDTVISEIIRLIENAEKSKARYMQISDKLAAFYTPIVLTLSTLTFSIWYFILHSTFSDSLLYAVSTLIITCPCALGLAVPVVQVIATSGLMNNGIMLKSSTALERLNKINTVALDKTGTLTFGAPQFINIDEFSDSDKLDLKAIASNSRHPLCKAIVQSIEGAAINSAVYKVEEIQGKGLSGKIRGKNFKLGNRLWCGIKDDTKEDNNLESWFSIEGRAAQRLIFRDQLRPEAYRFIRQIKSKGTEVLIISGDRDSVVKDVAQELGIQKYYAKCTPQDKYELIKKQDHALMVGDGLNDSISLKAAFVSAAPTRGLDIAHVNSDIVYRSNLLLIIRLLDTAKTAIKLVKQNFALSLSYNMLTIPMAVAGYATPFMAAIAMSSSSILVVLNSLRLNYGQYNKQT